MNWSRLAIGFGILIALGYIVRLFGGIILMDLAFVLIVMPVTILYMFSDDTNDVIKEEDEES